MITLHDIEVAIVGRLRDGGHTATANEVVEGFSKPTFFVNIFQNSTKLENPFMKLMNVGVELKYLCNNPTHEELVKTADALTALFTQTPIKVQERFLTVQEITFDTESETLLVYFELEFMDEIAANVQEYEKVAHLLVKFKIGGDLNGTSADID